MGAVRGARPPSQTAYYVALAGILTLLLLLCCYFFYFCIRRVKELASQPLPSPVKSVRPPPPEKPAAYPVQPGVRESATAMARLCQVPAAQTDTVYPRSPTRPPAVAARAARPTRASSLPPPRIVSRSISPHSPQCPTENQDPTVPSSKNKTNTVQAEDK